MATFNPLLSIIIISYNTEKITKDCIDSIYKSLSSNSPNHPNLPFELIVIDNASTDDSPQMLQSLQKHHDNLILIQNEKNTGFAKANNQAVFHAKGVYLLFLNSDTVVLDNAIKKLILYFRENEDEVHFLGGKLLNKDLTPQASCGPFYSLPVVFAALFLKGDYWSLTRYSPNITKEIDWISGACILTKKSYYEKIGGFDEKIFMYMDEIDLLYRAKKQEFHVWFYPKAQFIHLGSASSGNKTYPILQVYRGFLYFYNKHHSPLSMLFLKVMLQLKALTAIIIGKITNNKYLLTTYGEALELIKMA
ncbi:MAG: glycosyltransferase family 2 protein [Candidatus Roizmanbacteria bacterium]|nr:MAG: glycosyltransferase family 2 protein [Candidatus Roizmanbacteria bacterium]